MPKTHAKKRRERKERAANSIKRRYNLFGMTANGKLKSTIPHKNSVNFFDQ